MALKVDYVTRSKIKVPGAYVTIRDAIWRATKVEAEGVVKKVHFLQAEACIWQSPEHASTGMDPLEVVELVFVADPAKPAHEQAYAALRAIDVMVYNGEEAVATKPFADAKDA